ncbi:MAG: SUMF1/EgtB/PvdO family nonheme iron enzyme, partial [Proteobacteria bacterium]|nr:SUMF1/EgtB/PvdO family nonheme iron enzyme [Pseudomonadota bacterium]
PTFGVAHDFSSPVTYTVTAADGSTKDYTVTVTAASSSSKDITKFTILGIDGTIIGSAISLTVPYGTGLTSLTPTITITGTSVSPAVGVAHDFSSDVAYTVTAADGSTKAYTVTVTAATSSSKDIVKFTILGVDGLIGTNTILLIAPYGTGLTSLTPTITITGVSVSPTFGAPNDFSSPVTYTVTAADSSTKDYIVTVHVPGQIATFTADGVTFNMAYVPGGITFPTDVDDSGTATVSDAYWIGETVVTYELWNKVYTWAIANGYYFANSGTDGGDDGTPGIIHGINEPVTTVDWRDAMVFSNALTEWYNAINGTSYVPVYKDSGTPIRDSRGTNAAQCDAATQDTTANGFRLLVSNEWELAARYKNGTSWTPGNYASGSTDYAFDDISWSPNPDEAATEAVAWYAGANPAVTPTGTQAVKLLDQNALGLYDMNGNVWEWNFEELYSGVRVQRSGSFGSDAYGMQVGHVDGYYVDSPDGYTGFRVAKTEL